jgi:hypothetical protein
MAYAIDHPIDEPVPIRELAEAAREARGITVERAATDQERLNAQVNSFIRSALPPSDDDEDRGE